MTAHAADLSISKATVRLAPPVASSTAAYATIRNPGDAAVTIQGVSATKIAGQSSIHDMQMHDGMMHMAPLSLLTIAAGETIHLQPGGKHLMLENLKRALHPNEEVTITMILSNGSHQSFTAKVIDMRSHDNTPGHLH